MAVAELTFALILALDRHVVDATIDLRAAANTHPRAVKALLAEKANKPKAHGFGVTIGGAEEAWLYREAHRELWRERGALNWAAEVLAKQRPTGQRPGKIDRDLLSPPDRQIDLPLSNDG